MSQNHVIAGDAHSGSGLDGVWFHSEIASSTAPVLIYVYGGTFVMNAGPSHDAIAQRLADAAGGRVFRPTYSLAPEAPFPLAVNDIVAVYRSLVAGSLVPRQIVLVADTAGAQIALGALTILRDQGDDLPAGAVFVFPWVDLTMSGGSYIDNIAHDGRVSDLELLSTLLSDYLQGANPEDALASPVRADLHALPSMHVHANYNDILADDARLLAARVREAGGECKLHIWDDVPDTLQKVDVFKPQMVQLIETVGRFARSATRDEGSASDRKKAAIQGDYLEMVDNHVQPHMAARIEEMFEWAKTHGPDWVWSFMEKRVEHGALVTQEEIEHDWLRRLFAGATKPLAVLTASRFIVQANDLAERIFQMGDPLRKENGRLVGATTQLERALGTLVQRPFAPDHSPIRRDQSPYLRCESRDGRAVFLECRRLPAMSNRAVAPPAALLRLHSEDLGAPAVQPDALAVWFHLSPREAALAAAFVEGMGLAEYAEATGVSMATVRTHFAHLKSKLNVRDQAGVVRKILTFAA